jgi:hypothetical protein
MQVEQQCAKAHQNGRDLHKRENHSRRMEAQGKTLRCHLLFIGIFSSYSLFGVYISHLTECENCFTHGLKAHRVYYFNSI